MNDINAGVTHREPLFPDEIAGEDAAGFNELLQMTAEQDFMTTAKMIYAVKKTEQEIAAVTANMAEAVLFYQRRKRQLEDNIAMLKGKIEGHLRLSGVRKLVTHLGTAFLAKRRKEHWPSDDVLHGFAQERCPDTIESRPVINKARLKDWCKANSTYPPGYEETTGESVSIRDASERGGDNAY